MINLSELHSETCPNLVEELQALLVALAAKTNQRICDESQILFDLIESGDKELGDRVDDLQEVVDGLTDIPNFTADISNLKALVDSLDLDQDGAVVNDLLKIQEKADDAAKLVADLLTRVDKIEPAVNENSNLIQTLTQNFTTFQTAITNALDSLKERVSKLETDLSALTEKVEGLGSSSAGDVYCAIGNAIKAAAPAFMDAFDQALGEPCNVGASSPASSGSTGTAPSFASGV